MRRTCTAAAGLADRLIPPQGCCSCTVHQTTLLPTLMLCSCEMATQAQSGSPHQYPSSKGIQGDSSRCTRASTLPWAASCSKRMTICPPISSMVRALAKPSSSGVGVPKLTSAWAPVALQARASFELYLRLIKGEPTLSRI